MTKIFTLNNQPIHLPESTKQREQDTTPMKDADKKLEKMLLTGITEMQRHQQHLIFTAILTGDTDHLNRLDDKTNDLAIVAEFLTQEWKQTHTPKTQTRHMIDVIHHTRDRQETAQKYIHHIHKGDNTND